MKKYLISGATGIIGSELIKYLAERDNATHFFILTRDEKKCQEKFAYLKNVEFINWVNLQNSLVNDVDAIIHLAAPTSSSYFVDKPVETIDTIYSYTKLLLDYARQKKVKSFIFMSSMEVYGELESWTKVKEKEIGFLDIQNVRSSYPMAKRLAELLCLSYCKEYGVPVKIIRPTLVIPTLYSRDDNRVIPFAIKCIEKGVDIELATDGNSKRDYIGVLDLVKAICLIEEKGQIGGVYNASNEDSYCSINEMLECLLRVKESSHLKILHKKTTKTSYYPKKQCIALDNEALKCLGWQATESLEELLRKANLDKHDDDEIKNQKHN